MEGELRFALAYLNECKDKYKEVVENISHLKDLLDRGNKVIDECEIDLKEKTRECSMLKEEVMNLKRGLKYSKDQISDGLKIKGGNEIQESILQFKINEEFNELFKINEDKGKEIKNATEDKKNFMAK